MSESTHVSLSPEKKISMGQAIIGGKCPRCRTGRVFPYGMYNLTKFSKTNRECPHCKQNFETEPGFFYGAMYVGYAVNVGLIITTLLLYLIVFPQLSEFVVIGFISSLVLILVPFNFRFSRIIYLYLFGPIRYDAKAARGDENK